MLAARAFLIAVYQSDKLSKVATHGLAQLFRNPASAWGYLRAQLAEGRLDDESQLLDIEAAQAFRRFARTLIDARLPAPPSRVERVAPQTVSKPEEAAPAPDIARNHEKADDTSPALDLFQRQVQRAMAVKRADTNRLPMHWQRMTPDEARPVLQRCARDLAAYKNNPSQSLRRATYAAMRILSLQSGLPMRDCFRLPLIASGDLYLDLERGLIVRDWSHSVPEWIGGKDARKLEVFVAVEANALTVLRDLKAFKTDAITVGQMVQALGVTLRMMAQSLNADWPTSHRPEDARFAASWPMMLLSLGVAPGVVARMTGDVMVVPIEDNRYGAIHDDDIDEAMRAFCDSAGLTPTELPHPRKARGSAKLRPLGEIRDLVLSITRLVDEQRAKIKSRSSIEATINFHNTYTAAVALLLEWMHGTRCTKPERRTAEALIGATAYVCISDKKTDLYGEARVLPKTSICAELLGRYCEHLNALAARLAKTEHPAAKHVLRVANGQIPGSPIFLLLENDGVRNNRGYRNLRRSDLAGLFLSIGANAQFTVEQDHLNCCRHLFYYELVRRKVWQVAIDSLLGHHTAGAEPHGFFSGLSMRQLSDYTRPVLQTLQRELGVTPLVGLGRTESRYLTPPPLRLDRKVPPLPNSYLLRKLREDEELSADFFAREQDPPATLATLRFHAALDALKDAYLRSGAVAQHAAGALLFCMTTFDAVVSRDEQEKLWQELAARPPYAISAHAVAEVVFEGRPVLQRSISQHTLAAWALLELGPGPRTWDAALSGLHVLLRQLRVSWPGTTPSESLSLLSTLMSHWCAVEIAPGSMFCAYHRAPFAPAKHLARIALHKPCLPDESEPADRVRFRQKVPFSDVQRVVVKWANPDAALGEKEARRSGCIRDLEGLLNDAGRESVELCFIDQVIADLSPGAPYKQLSVATIAQRIGKYSHCYEIFRRESTFELDREAFDDLLNVFGGPDAVKVSDTARWVLLHVAAFLSARGHRHCLNGVKEKALKFTPPLRAPVYVSARELSDVCQRLPSVLADLGAAFPFSDLRLLLERNLPSRHSEIKYLRVQDLDERACLVHFTSSGHAHLKGGAHGSWHVPPELMRDIEKLKRLKLELGGGKGALLFADSHEADPYRYFDVVTESSRRLIVAVTGCPEFRRHDFRSAALTDLCIGGGVDQMLGAPWLGSAKDVVGQAQLEQMYLRFRLAQRAARHSSAYTTCRHYNVGGVLDLRRELDRADALRVSGAAYIRAVLASRSQSAAAPKRGEPVADGPRGGAEISRFAKHCCRILSDCPVPELAADLPPAPAPRDAVSETVSVLAHAVMLNSLGSSIPAITAAAGVSAAVAERAINRVQTILESLRLHCSPRHPVNVFSTRPGARVPRNHLIRKYAAWLTEPARHLKLKRLGPAITSCVDRHAHALVLSDEDTILELMEALTGIDVSGVRAFLTARSPSTSIRSAAESAGVTCLEEDSGSLRPTLRMLFCDERARELKSLERVSPRTLGLEGRAAIAGLLSAICL